MFIFSMYKETIKALNRIVPLMPVSETDETGVLFSVSDLIEKHNQKHNYDTLITEFLLKGKFATLSGVSENCVHDENRLLALTGKGEYLKRCGTYEQFIGMLFRIILKRTDIDVYDWWISQSHFKRDGIKTVVLAISALLIIEFLKWATLRYAGH